MSSSQLSIVNSKSQKSWHHRMARLVRDAFAVRCERPGCDGAASYVCEYDHQRSGKPVSGRKLYCAEHAGNFALKHNIYMADLPEVLHSQIETASRDDWRYADENKSLATNEHESVQSVKSVSEQKKEEF